MRKILKLLVLSDLLIISSFGLITPIISIFINKNLEGGSIAAAGIASSIYLITKGLVQIPSGKLADKYGLKKFLLIGTFLVILTLLGYFLMTNVIHLYILQIVYGIGAAFAYPPWLAIFSRNLSRGKEGYEWSVYAFFVNIGTAIAAFFGGVIAQFIGFRFLFLFGFLISCLGFSALLFVKPIELERWARGREYELLVGGIILKNGKLLVIKKGKKCFLPGGKIVGDEFDSSALLSNIKDDLEDSVSIKDMIYFNTYRFKLKDKRILLKTYIVTLNKEIKISKRLIWLSKEDIEKYELSEALKRVVNDLIKSNLFH